MFLFSKQELRSIKKTSQMSVVMMNLYMFNFVHLSVSPGSNGMLLKRGMGNWEWGMGNGEWEIENGKLKMGKGEMGN